MMKTNNVEREFAEAKLLLDKIKRIFNLLSAWPINSTKKQLIFFILAVIHESIYLTFAYYDLICIFGDIQLMTTNLIGTLVQTIMMIRLIFIKFSTRLKDIILEIKDDICDKNYQDLNDKFMYVQYSGMAIKFYKLTMMFGICAAINFYFLPLQNYFISRYLHQPATLELPYKMKVFIFNDESFEKIIMLYIFEANLPVVAVCYFATVNMQFLFITNVCARTVILANKIKQIDSNKNSIDIIIKNIVIKHLELIRLTKRIEEIWTPVFLLEIIFLIPLLALVLFNTILAFESNDKGAIVMLFIYVCAILSCLFANCLMGELLLTEHNNLLETFYLCNWKEMSNKSKKSWLVCMISCAKIPMQLTAGKIYIFSFNGFTGILRSSMAYVSLLRTMTA